MQQLGIVAFGLAQTDTEVIVKGPNSGITVSKIQIQLANGCEWWAQAITCTAFSIYTSDVSHPYHSNTSAYVAGMKSGSVTSAPLAIDDGADLIFYDMGIYGKQEIGMFEGFANITATDSASIFLNEFTLVANSWPSAYVW
eukprot:PhF_6_TR10734/c0_g1_i1/m.17284